MSLFRFGYYNITSVMFAVFFFERIGWWGVLAGPCVFFLLVYCNKKIIQKRTVNALSEYCQTVYGHQKDINFQVLSALISRSDLNFQRELIPNETLKAMVKVNFELEITIVSMAPTLNNNDLSNTTVSELNLKEFSKLGCDKIFNLPFILNGKVPCNG